MEVNKTLKVPAEFFYQKVIDSVLYDVKETTGKTVTEAQLSGLEYVKEFNNKTSAKILIQEAVKDQSYKFRTATTKNTFDVSYQIKAVDDHSCAVTYRESMTSVGTIQSLNDTVTGFLLGFFKKKQLKKMLSMIEASY